MGNLRIFDILTRHKEKFKKDDALASKVAGKWELISSAAYVENSDLVSCGLLKLGIKKGDKIATISNNRFEWNFLDMGMLQVGAVHVPIYPSISESDYKFILNDAEVTMVFVSDEDLFTKIQNIKKEVPSLKDIFTINEVAGARNWKEVTETGKSAFEIERVDEIKSGITARDVATLIYTSGTTGNPKGVMLTHNNLCSNFLACEKLPPVDETCKALSFLPLCHVYERMLTYLYQYLGVSIYYAESLEKIVENLKEVKPELFSTVPRLLEKVYDKIVAKGSELTGIKRSLFFWALDLGLKYQEPGKNSFLYEMKLGIANKLIFSKWREALGGRVRVIVSGGAALQPRLARVFWAAKIHVLEGYGLTETSPVIAVNSLEPGGLKFGTVGKVIPGVEVRIAADGEILAKGPNVMAGYYKRPDLTSEVIDNEGWFHTGDIGVLFENKYLKITDRKKEMFKTSGGKYIAPQPLENKFKESPFIEQIMVIGDGQKHASALIVPAFAYLREWCVKKNIIYTTNAQMVENPQVIDRINREVNTINKEFGHVEQIKRFRLVGDEWTNQTGELTPTLKLKRKFIEQKYQKIISEIYSK